MRAVRESALLRCGFRIESGIYFAWRFSKCDHHPHGGTHTGSGTGEYCFFCGASGNHGCFLSTGLLEELSRELIAGGYTAETPAAIVYKATWKEEEKYICTVGTLAQTAKEHNITKTALMIIGEAVTHSNYARSELYNPNFSTEYRKAKGEDKA